MRAGRFTPRWVHAASVMAIALSLTACSGIPTSGGVLAGPVIDEEIDPRVVIVPSGPRAGSTQEELLDDFMQAVRGSQNDYAVAKLFLTVGLAASWNPDASTVIRASPRTLSVGTSPDELTYAFSSRAFVNADGRYVEQRDLANQTLSFRFVEEGGEWRMSEAPDGIVLSQTSFSIAFREQALYFFDPTYRFLVPDVRWFPSRQTIPARIVRALLSGPTSWLQGGVVRSEFPTATALGPDGVELRAGTATVDLTEEVLSATPVQRERMRQQLLATLNTVTSGVSQVNLTVNGLAIVIPETTTPAIQNPQAERSPLVGADAIFGFATGEEITSLDGLSPVIVGAGATAVTLAEDRQAAAFLAGTGAVAVAQVSQTLPIVVDERVGLISPSIDGLNFVWSVPAGDASGLTAFGLDGEPHSIASTLPVGATVVSIDVSRDGTRILLALSTDLGPRLVVAGIIRQDNIPVALGELVELPVAGDVPVDTAWVDDRSVALLSRSGTEVTVTQFALGGPSSSLGTLVDARAIVGGNGGADGLWILAADGEILRPQGGGGWSGTGQLVSFIATQQ
ncbi:MAG: LpqB family beta-propeller domain-containing protein [Salinibacterium sp.]|nr:LpqB family beta-propeller domain-containing protein [Salinibacterium sp.]